MIALEWYRGTGLNSDSLPDTDSPIGTKINGGSLDDITSRILWVQYKGNTGNEQIKRFIKRSMDRFPFVVTSCYRPTGTHLWGAVDIAPDLSCDPAYASRPSLYSHNVGIDPRLYARKPFLDVLYNIAKDLFLISVLVEDNHVHIHQRLNPGLSQSFPSTALTIQVRPRSAYERSVYDQTADNVLSDLFYWVPYDPSTYSNITFPPFKARF